MFPRDIHQNNLHLQVEAHVKKRIRRGVFPTEGFLRPGTQVRRFGHKLNTLPGTIFSCTILMPIFKKLGFQATLT